MASHLETSFLTIAKIRKGSYGEDLYLFNERQRIFGLSDEAAAEASALRPLLADELEDMLLEVTLDLEVGKVLKISVPPAPAGPALVSVRQLLESPDRAVPIEITSIDPTNFDVVDQRLKWKAFDVCTTIVPDYAKAKEIFDFCASLSCDLAGPPVVSPCIPFQYVRDGCYARAHQMRRLITKNYGVCCDKVFSFANKNDDRLAVRADKWGGCCVIWWYHVAPLLRVSVSDDTSPNSSIVQAIVIDPSMFNTPVLLSSWLSSQQLSACSTHAHVSMYSIQPGSAYAPGNYEGTKYVTDETYAETEKTLEAYKSLASCP